MGSNKKKFSLIDIFLISSSLDVFKPFDAKTIEDTFIELSLGYNVQRSRKEKIVLVYTSMDFKVVEKEIKKIEQSNHLTMSIQYVLKYEDNFTAEKKIFEKLYCEHAIESVWPYFRQEIDTFMTKTGYHPFYLPPFDKSSLK